MTETNAADNALGQQIKALRGNMSQLKASVLAGVSQQMWSKLERAEATAEASVSLYKIAAAYGCIVKRTEENGVVSYKIVTLGDGTTPPKGTVTSVDRVWSVLAERGISDATFAEVLDETPQTIYNWKQRMAIPEGKVFPVADALCLNPRWVRDGIAPKLHDPFAGVQVAAAVEETPADGGRATSAAEKWDLRMLRLAAHYATWSKDPSTRVGAVIADDRHRTLGHGYNGFPRGVEDSHARYADREIKYQMVVHAEVNAVLNSVKSVEGCTLYCWPLPPCPECVKALIQTGVKRIVYAVPELRATGSAYSDLTEVAATMMREAGVEWTSYPVADVGA